MKHKLNGIESAKGKGFDNRPENINRKGRPLSIRNSLKALLNSDGRVTIEKKDVAKINEDGSIIIKLPTAEQIAYKLSKIATTGKNMNTLKAIEILLKQTEEPITKKLEVVTEPKEDTKLNNLSFQELLLIKLIHIANAPEEMRSNQDNLLIDDMDRIIDDARNEIIEKVR